MNRNSFVSLGAVAFMALGIQQTHAADFDTTTEAVGPVTYTTSSLKLHHLVGRAVLCPPQRTARTE
ncbi:MAG TPA: hypothetical protein VFY06_07725 [Verrucomicrobiae bacterium]|nr:hypothetical protein [Verrucomicrobiae bacterium]